jgi:hypothetical protein
MVKKENLSSGQSEESYLLGDPMENKSGMYLNLLADEPGEARAAVFLNSLVDDPDKLGQKTLKGKK